MQRTPLVHFTLQVLLTITGGGADGIRVWESADLKDWKMIGNNGFVWTFDKNASNDAQREIKIRKGRMVRGIWAPEIHYINSNFFITYSVSGVIPIGTGTLKNAFPIDFEGNRRFEDFDTTTKMIDFGYQKYIDGKY